jgi:hypothetical protein
MSSLYITLTNIVEQIPGAAGFVVGGPLGAVGGTSVGLIMAYHVLSYIPERTNFSILVLCLSGKYLVFL